MCVIITHKYSTNITMKNIEVLFQNAGYKDIYNIDDVYILLNPNWRKIAVSVSGGADSAILLFLLSSLIDKNNLSIDIHVITNIRMWKSRPWQRKNSLDVFNYIRNKFPKINYARHENFIAPDLEFGNIGRSIKDSNGNLKSGDQITVIAHAEYVCCTNNINAWFAGITKNPPDISNGMDDRNADFSGDIKELIAVRDNIYACHPFKYITKKWIIDQYRKQNLIELLNITRSCEGDNIAYPDVFKGLDYKSYKETDTVPECGICFWCKERQWALMK
jgi:hypothetical protein